MLRTRYERLMLARSVRVGDLAAAFAEASRAARAAISVTGERETAIRDVAAGVAGPALTGFVLWMLIEARKRGLRRLRFLSRDGQVFYELARRIGPALGISLDLEYVYSSRLTWSLAATSPGGLSAAPWLFNSFMKPNAGDICARLGLPFDACKPALADAGVSLDPGARADQPVPVRGVRILRCAYRSRHRLRRRCQAAGARCDGRLLVSSGPRRGPYLVRVSV